MRNALIEVSDRLSAAPASLVAEGPSGIGPAAPAALDAVTLVSGSLETLARRAGEGVPQSVAALAVMADIPGAAFDRVAQALAADAGGEWSSQDLYALSSRFDAEGREADAIATLGVLAGTDWGEMDGCLGLAVIAARRRRFDEALALASFCLRSEARHPRALCIVGICELERGNVAGAQSYLAAAARLARSNPLFRGDLQAAQRALLLMHLS